MMAGAGSTTVSGAGTPVAGPAGRDIFAEGLLEFLQPAVQQLDSHVHAVRCPRGEVGRGLSVSGGLGGRGQERAESRWVAAQVLRGLRWETGGWTQRPPGAGVGVRLSTDTQGNRFLEATDGPCRSCVSLQREPGRAAGTN